MLRSNGGFAEFWPDYLRAHRKSGTRICHYVATLWGVSLGLYGIATLQIGYIIAATAGGYALAVASHYAFKDGKPLVRRSAVMGARADFRMIGLALMGRLDDEFRKYGIAEREPSGKRRLES
jgi:hypothetical protein